MSNKYVRRVLFYTSSLAVSPYPTYGEFMQSGSIKMSPQSLRASSAMKYQINCGTGGGGWGEGIPQMFSDCQ